MRNAENTGTEKTGEFEVSYSDDSKINIPVKDSELEQSFNSKTYIEDKRIANLPKIP